MSMHTIRKIRQSKKIFTIFITVSAVRRDRTSVYREICEQVAQKNKKHPKSTNLHQDNSMGSVTFKGIRTLCV